VPGLYLEEKFVVTTSILKPTQPPHIAGPLEVIRALLKSEK